MFDGVATREQMFQLFNRHKGTPGIDPISGTPKGIAGEANPDAWPVEHHGKRTILVYAAGQGTTLKLLEDLSDEEIDSRMLDVRARLRRGGTSDGEPS